MNNRAYGAQGERAAQDHLLARGARVMALNYRCPAGEIDLIVSMDGFVAFVEVKRRAGRGFGTPAEAVGAAKRAHIRRAALWYLKENRIRDARMRFDVVEVTAQGVRHIPGAFQ